MAEQEPPFDPEKLKSILPERYFKKVRGLTELVQYLQTQMDTYTMEDIDFRAACAFVREERWVYLCVAILDEEHKKYNKPKVLNMNDGFPLVDFGNEWCVSRGEDPCLLAKGKLIRSLFFLFDRLTEENISHIAIEGGEYPKRAAWIFAQLAGITIENYDPTPYDKSVLSQVKLLSSKNINKLKSHSPKKG